MREIKSVEQVDETLALITFDDDTSMRAWAKHVDIGQRTMLSKNLRIGMPDKPVERFIVGDGCRLFAGVIAPRNFACGDYVTIHQGVWAYGRSDIKIGHNSWFGMRCTLDAEGGFSVGSGFGAGQDTHMWSHIRHGDIMQGSRFLSFGKFSAGHDVWLVGRCTSAPVSHASFSVAMTESNLTKGMPENTIWGGNPAKDLTEKIGAPFKIPTDDEREGIFYRKMKDFPMFDKLTKADLDKFHPLYRTYEKDGSYLQHSIMRFLLPEIKLMPEHD